MTPEHDILQVTPRVEALAALCRSNSRIDPALYRKYDVKRGLRDINGQGVLAGLTNISDIISRKEIGGEIVPCEGELYYRGIRIQDLVQGFVRDGRKGYEEAAYLLLFGELPDAKRLGDFKALLAQGRTLPTNFTRDVIMKAPTRDMMNSLSRSVLTLASYDSNADDISLPNVLRQCLMLISVFPMLAVYSYHAYNHYECGGSMYIHYPSDSLSTASNFLRMLRPDMQYTPLEASVLDLALVLHMEHGGGNNSSFTTHVLTSADTDAYSTYAAAIGSLKGRKHGGANHQVLAMQKEIKENVVNWENDDEVAAYLAKIVNKQAYDKSGLVYGMGHAVYTLSDPRAVICKRFAEKLAIGTEFEAEFRLLEKIERLAPEVILNEKGTRKDMCANVDMYSGFVYSMLGIPEDLFTPLFACARMSGWAAHRFEEIVSGKRIIRPAYKSIYSKKRAYIPMDER